MPDIPIHNETDHVLTSWICDYIQHDAVEYFGEAIRSIRVQCGIDRSALNAKTGEVRYAFFPSDYGFGDITSAAVEADTFGTSVPCLDDDIEELVPSDFDDDTDDDTLVILDDDANVSVGNDHDESQDFDTDDEMIEGATYDFL